MYGAVLAIHLIVCITLVAVVLVQSGKGGGLAGGAFAASTQTAFGGRGATDFITKATIWLGVTFFITSVVLAKLTTASGPGARKSLMQEEARKANRSAPARVPAAGSGTQGGAPAPATPAPATPAPAGGAPAPASGTR